MINKIFATKIGMSQVWTKTGKRLPVTKCLVADNLIVGQQTMAKKDWLTQAKAEPSLILEVGYGRKKLKNVKKPLREKIIQSGFSLGVRQVRGVKVTGQEAESAAESFKPGQILKLDQVLAVGDLVKVSGISKGKGYAGVVKRHGMKGGPKTHGQTDRERAIGSIGCRTDPGRVWPGKRMSGHMGNERQTVINLPILHLDLEKKEVWLAGPIPGANGEIVEIITTDQHRKIDLNQSASGLVVPTTPAATSEVIAANQAEPTK